MAVKRNGALYLDKDEANYLECMIEACWDDDSKTSHRDVVTTLEAFIETAEVIDDD